MRVLYCNCTYANVVPPEVKRAVLRKLSAANVPFDAVADLCAMAARKDPRLGRLAGEADLRIAACYPRAVKCLFNAAGAPLAEEGVEVLNMRCQSAAEVVSRLLSEQSPQQERPS
jgi:hypothetical protein